MQQRFRPQIPMQHAQRAYKCEWAARQTCRWCTTCLLHNNLRINLPRCTPCGLPRAGSILRLLHVDSPVVAIMVNSPGVQPQLRLHIPCHCRRINAQNKAHSYRVRRAGTTTAVVKTGLWDARLYQRRRPQLPLFEIFGLRCRLRGLQNVFLRL